MANRAVEQDVFNLVGEVWGVPPNANNIRDFTNVDWPVFIYALVDRRSPWGDRYDILGNRYPRSLQQIQDLTKVVSVKDGVIADQVKQIDALKAQAGVVSEDTDLLNSFGKVLAKLIARLGLNKG